MRPGSLRAAALPDGAAVLDLGCGSGEPETAALAERGLTVYGMDASPTMSAAFRARYPDAEAECATVEEPTFFGHQFQAIVAWGLFFLLPAATQRELIAKMAGAIKSGGKLLFTAPSHATCWRDGMTGQESVSLGRDEYVDALEAGRRRREPLLPGHTPVDHRARGPGYKAPDYGTVARHLLARREDWPGVRFLGAGRVRRRVGGGLAARR